MTGAVAITALDGPFTFNGWSSVWPEGFVSLVVVYCVVVVVIVVVGQSDGSGRRWRERNVDG